MAFLLDGVTELIKNRSLSLSLKPDSLYINRGSMFLINVANTSSLMFNNVLRPCSHAKYPLASEATAILARTSTWRIGLLIAVAGV